MNKFYVSLAVLVVWLAGGLGVAAPWFFATFSLATAFALDFFCLIVPFVLISIYVIRQRRLVPDAVSIPVILAIGALYYMTIANIYRILHEGLQWF